MSEAAQAIRAVKDELDRAAREYAKAKKAFDDAHSRFEAARERLARVRELASGMLTTYDWADWEDRNWNVRYAAKPIGQALLGVLELHAFTQARYHVAGGTPYTPSMPLEDIVGCLERGGFEFRSTTPLREVNAALINLTGVERLKDGSFVLKQADGILELTKAVSKGETQGEPTSQKGEEELPFE